MQIVTTAQPTWNLRGQPWVIIFACCYMGPSRQLETTAQAMIPNAGELPREIENSNVGHYSWLSNKQITEN